MERGEWEKGCGIEGIFQGPELFFPEFDLIIDLPGIDDQLRFHFHKVVIVRILFHGQVLLQESRDLSTPPVYILFQDFGFVQLLTKLVPLAFQDFLNRNFKKKINLIPQAK